MKTPTDILVEMRTLIATGWCRAREASYADGTTCNVFDPAAKCFCLTGAWRRASEGAQAYASTAALVPVYGALRKKSLYNLNGLFHIAEYNDTHTQQQVLELLDEAIAASRASHT